MTRRFLQMIALLTAILGFGVAHADELGDARSRVIKLENDWGQLDANRMRLERESSDLGAQIESVKSEPAGVRRDFKLRELLAQAKSKADELTKVAAELRWRIQPLADARMKLVAACDRALQQPNLNEARRLELARLRTSQVALLATPAAPLGGKLAAPVAVDPLDGPRELKEKADLLRDSGDKLKREVARLSARIDDVERRRHLRERAGAVDEDWFGETTSNRKFARVGGTSNASLSRGGDTKTQGDANNSPTAGAPAPQTPGVTGGTTGGTTGGAVGGTSGGTGGTSGGGGGTPPMNNGNFNNSGDTNNHASDTTVLRNLVDPATLDELRRADGGDDLDRQVRALKRAQGELEGLAAELERRAKSLSHRADELKKQK